MFAQPSGSNGTAASAPVDVVIPVFNEERRLQLCVEKLHRFLQQRLPPGSWQIVIADNGSTDRTQAIAQALAERYPSVRTFHVDRAGRGGALTYASQHSQAEIIAYTDVDLSTDLEALPRLIGQIQQGGDLAVGSRLLPGAEVVRSFRREMLSRSYNALVRWIFHAPLTDAQCGFKAMRRRSLLALLPEIQARHWFFDTELLLKAHRSGLRIRETPVRWVEDPDSRVKLPSTIFQMAWGLIRLRWQMFGNGH